MKEENGPRKETTIICWSEFMRSPKRNIYKILCGNDINKTNSQNQKDVDR